MRGRHDPHGWMAASARKAEALFKEEIYDENKSSLGRELRQGAGRVSKIHNHNRKLRSYPPGFDQHILVWEIIRSHCKVPH